MNRRTALRLAAGVAASALLVACAPVPRTPDIVDVAASDARFSTLVAAVQAAGLVETLKGDGPFTVFAPTDEAFAKVPKEKLKKQLQHIALSRTGGAKTDEVLGKTGGGPEGLPHSIIVTEDGVENETTVISEAGETGKADGPSPGSANRAARIRRGATT